MSWSVGDLVRFAHQADEGPSHRVSAIAPKEMIELADMCGQFASSLFVAAPPVTVLDVSADGMSALVEVLPLSDLGLDGAIIINAETGEEIEPFQGFVALPGKSFRESIRAALGPGRDLKLPAKREERKT